MFYSVLPKRECQVLPFHDQNKVIGEVVSLNSLLGTLNARGALKASMIGKAAHPIPISQASFLPRLSVPFIPTRERVR